MFRKSIELYKYTGKLIIRNYAPRSRGSNPGINRQLRIFDDEPTALIEDPENFGNIESDFMDVHQSHKQSEAEYREHLNNIQMKMIKNKYFRQKLPNFLTYAEKHQIRLLHNQDPNEWTIEKLTDSFPADFNIIQKIIKAKWTPRSEKRIRIHDEKVIENWKLLKEGKFPELHSEFLEKLKQFTPRTKEDLMNIQINTSNIFDTMVPKPKKQEFLNLVSCNKSTDDSKLLCSGQKEIIINDEHKNPFNTTTQQYRNPNTDDETYLKDKVLDKRPMRFQDLVNNEILPETIQQDEEEHNSKEINNNSKNETTFVQQFVESKEIVINQSDVQKFNVTKIKERIHIPKKLWKHNATYKVEDCYYDYDGEFLYRVPGMTNN